MEPFKPRAGHGPEFHIQKRWTAFLEAKGWLVERLAMGSYMSGLPDIYIGHPEFGQRWIDIKVYGKYNFTPAQKIKWPEWESYGIGIWILGADSPEECTKEHMIKEYPKLFGQPNMRDFWKASWDKPGVDQLLDEIEQCQSDDVAVKVNPDSDGEQRESVIPTLPEINLQGIELGEMPSVKEEQSKLTRKGRSENIDTYGQPADDADQE